MYAWFTMNKEVSVTGMQLNTKVSDNLLISTDELTSTAIKGDDTFYNSLIQTAGGLIEPVSTVNAENFYYTAGTNVRGNGDAMTDNYALYNPDSRLDFANAYALSGDDATNVVGYVDYVYQLKAINGSVDSQIRLTKLDLNYGGADNNSQKAYRVAIFAQDLGYKTGDDTGKANTHAAISTLVDPVSGVGTSTLKTIFTPASAANFTEQSAGSGTYKAVSGTTTLGNVTYYNGSNFGSTYFSLDVGTNRTQYYKVIVRVWLEGEDTTCNNATFMDLTDKWSLDMKWEMTADSTATSGADSVIPVVNITQNVTSEKIDLTSGVTMGDASTYDGYTLYPITKTGTSGLYSDTATVTNTSHIYQLDAKNHPFEVTNKCTLPTGS